MTHPPHDPPTAVKLVAAKNTSGAWQPISSAPKDGTRFWGKVGDDARAMFWHPQFEEFVSSFRRMTMAPGYLIDGEATKDHSPVVHHPEYWMPIPEPPASESTSDANALSADSVVPQGGVRA